ncbi:MAG: response regulator transcription factor [Acidobacteria bacterium]|nr:response regulator transcription factor [Acidobacteriota bacterium]
MADILIVDDHAVVRGLIRQVLEHEPDLKVAGEAATAAEALRLLPTHSWHAVVLDISLPDQSGLEVLRVIRRDFADVPVLILSMQSAEESAPYARQLGAAGYLMKEHAPDELLVAVRALLSGATYFKFPS